MTPTPATHQEIPAAWDGFGFTQHPQTKEFYVDFMTTMAEKYGQLPGVTPVADGRGMYHVILLTYEDGVVHLESPFKTSLQDPFIYAQHLAQKGYTGFIIRETQSSDLITETLLQQIKERSLKSRGFKMVN